MKLLLKRSFALALTASAISVAAYAQTPSADPTAAASAGAKNLVIYDPPALSAPSISLIDSVRTALENDPNLKLSEASTNYQAGAARVERGRFDTTLLGSLEFQFIQEELTKAEAKGQADRRDQERKFEEELTANLNNANDLIAEIERFQQDPDNFHVNNGSTQGQQLQSQIDLANALIKNANDPAVQAELARLRDQAVQSVKDKLIENRDRFFKAREERLESLRKLGQAATIKQRFNGSLDLRIQKPTRTGILLSAFLTTTADSQNYKSKKRASEFGGIGAIDLYRADAGVTFTIPLGRGAGLESADSRERAANIDYEASRLAFVHGGAQTALQTALAYWDLVSAQQNLAAFEESNRLQGRLVDLTGALIKGDELPAAEMPRIQASQSGIIGSVSGARRNLASARIALARSMGVRVTSEANAPLASSDFPEVASEETLRRIAPEALGDAAIQRRFDLQSVRKAQESGRVLLRAAQLDLAPRIDLSGDFKMSGLGESSSIRKGLDNALFHKWVGPGARLALNVEYPLGNNFQRGLALQAQASYDQRTINATDLERVIRANIAQTYASLVEAASAVRESANANRYYQQLTDAEFEKLRLGSSTLIDTILTEQRRTDAALSYVSARQQYAQLLAELRYETGTLVVPDDTGNHITPESLTQPPSLQQ